MKIEFTYGDAQEVAKCISEAIADDRRETKPTAGWIAGAQACLDVFRARLRESDDEWKALLASKSVPENPRFLEKLPARPQDFSHGNVVIDLEVRAWRLIKGMVTVRGLWVASNTEQGRIDWTPRIIMMIEGAEFAEGA